MFIHRPHHTVIIDGVAKDSPQSTHPFVFVSRKLIDPSFRSFPLPSSLIQSCSILVPAMTWNYLSEITPQ